MKVAGLARDSTRLLKAIADDLSGEASLELVVSPDEDTGATRAASDLGVPVAAVDLDDEAELLDSLEDHDADLVVVDDVAPEGPGTLSDDGRRVLVHVPTLDPAGDDRDPVASALESGRRVTGATVQVLTPSGPAVVAQNPVAVYGDDDRETLSERIYRDGAVTAMTRAVSRFARDAVAIDDDEVTLEEDVRGQLPARRVSSDDRVANLRYGENPHQDAALYGGPTAEANVVDAEQLNQGAKALSYNNYNDSDAALNLIQEFDRPAAAVIKHTNPAGCATAPELSEAYDRALSTDPMSAFGGIVALNRECDRATAAAVTDSFKEAVVAPGYSEAALSELFETDDLRVLDIGDFDDQPDPLTEKDLVGGRLVQERNLQRLTPADLEVVTEREPTDQQIETMLFAWQTTKHVMSNAILFAKGTETVGVGAGQVSRVDAVRIAEMKADEHAEGKSADGAVMASDAFFPFPDGLEVAAKAGIEAVIQPGGSVNDDEVIETADDLGMTMVFTGSRCFRHD